MFLGLRKSFSSVILSLFTNIEIGIKVETFRTEHFSNHFEAESRVDFVYRQTIFTIDTIPLLPEEQPEAPLRLIHV